LTYYSSTLGSQHALDLVHGDGYSREVPSRHLGYPTGKPEPIRLPEMEQYGFARITRYSEGVGAPFNLLSEQYWF
jgi:hypothetical protein